MKTEHRSYLQQVGLGNQYIERVRTLYGLVSTISPIAEVADIFVSEYVQANGVRVYENVWFFTAEAYHAIEAHNFISEDNVDFVTLKGRIKQFFVQKQKYDFERATEESRLNVEFRTDLDVIGKMKASKENCDHLRDIVLKYLRPNLMA